MLPPPGSCVIFRSVHFIFVLMESFWGREAHYCLCLSIACVMHRKDVCGFVRCLPLIGCNTSMPVAATLTNLPSLSHPVPQVFFFFFFPSGYNFTLNIASSRCSSTLPLPRPSGRVSASHFAKSLSSSWLPGGGTAGVPTAKARPNLYGEDCSTAPSCWSGEIKKKKSIRLLHSIVSS